MSIQNLINSLDVPDTDYWYDFGFDIAHNIIDENCEQIFEQLLLEWRSWPYGEAKTACIHSQ